MSDASNVATFASGSSGGRSGIRVVTTFQPAHALENVMQCSLYSFHGTDNYLIRCISNTPPQYSTNFQGAYTAG